MNIVCIKCEKYAKLDGFCSIYKGLLLYQRTPMGVVPIPSHQLTWKCTKLPKPPFQEESSLSPGGRWQKTCFCVRLENPKGKITAVDTACLTFAHFVLGFPILCLKTSPLPRETHFRRCLTLPTRGIQGTPASSIRKVSSSHLILDLRVGYLGCLGFPQFSSVQLPLRIVLTPAAKSYGEEAAVKHVLQTQGYMLK